MSELWSREQSAGYLGISGGAFDRMRRLGLIEDVSLGGKTIRFRASDIKRIAAEGTRPADRKVPCRRPAQDIETR